MKHRQQKEFKLSVMKAFGVSGISGACLGKNGMHFGCLSSLDFLLSLQTHSIVFSIHPQMKSTLKSEGAVNRFNRNRAEENLA